MRTRRRHVAGVSFLVAVVWVGGSIPGRWEPARSATDAWIGLRPLTVDEAALLLEHAEQEPEWARTALVGLDGREVLLATRHYVVPVADDDSREALGVREADGRRVSVLHATWERYCLLYRLDRAALEQRFGRPLTDADLDPSFLDDWRVSFAPHRLPLYALAEIAFLTIWLTATAATLLALRRWTLVLPVLLASALVPIAFVLWYSPAFADADWFHQRIAVEPLALLGMVAAAVLAIPAAASMLLYVALAAAEQIARRRKGSLRRHRLGAVLVLAILPVGWLLLRHGEYRAARRACEADLAAALARLDDLAWVDDVVRSGADDASGHDLLDSPNLAPELAAAIGSVLGPAPTAGQDLRLVVPAEGDRFLFLWADDSGGTHADVRPLSTLRNLIDGGDVDSLRTGRDERLARGFPSFLRRHHLCGRRASVSGRPVVVVVSEAFRIGPFQPGR